MGWLKLLIALILLELVNSSNSPSQSTIRVPIRCRLYSKCIVDLTTIEAMKFREDSVQVNSSNTSVFNFEPPKVAEFREDGNETYKITIIPVIIGKAKIEVFTSEAGDKRILADVIIERPNRVIDLIFDVYLWVYCGLMAFCMGALIERDVVHSYLFDGIQKEISVAFVCQYLGMPLIAYAVIKVFQCTPNEALGLFIYGITPGAFESSQWSEALGADVNLNSFAAIFSTLSSIILMPAWLYIFGESLMAEAEIKINIIGLALNIAVVIIPCIVGFFIGNRVPFVRSVSKFIHKFMITVVPVLVSVVLHVASKFYSFVYNKPINILTGSLISYVGYVLGGCMAWLFKLEGEKIRSVTIETGVQNTMLSMLIVNWNFPSPDSDIVLLLFVPILFQASTPLQICQMYKKIKTCIKKRRERSRDKNKTKSKSASPAAASESAAEKGEISPPLLDKKNLYVNENENDE